MPYRLHILGPAGSGTTTLAFVLSKRLGLKHLDTDDYYWAKTIRPFTQKIPVPQRLEAIETAIEKLDNWVLSGSICSWGEPLITSFTHIIYLWVPWEIRKQRLERRELNRYGPDSLAPGGEMHAVNSAFMDWASKYDTAGMEQRSRVSHEHWLADLPKHLPIIRLEEELTVDLLADRVMDVLALKSF